jgi:hypothetical protein
MKSMISKLSAKMMLGATSAIVVAGVVGPESASAITFTETFDSFNSGTTVSGPGVFADFELSAGSDSIIVTPFAPGPNFSGNSIQSDPFISASPFRADFSIFGVRGVSVTLGDYNQDPDNLFVRAFNSLGTLLDEGTFALPGTTYGGPTLSVSSASEDIAYVLFGSTGTFSNSVFADNFSYTVADSTSIPTPAILPGLIGMGVAALRKRKENVVEEEA